MSHPANNLSGLHNASEAKRPARGRWGPLDGLMLVSLVAMTLAVFWRLAVTDLIMGRGDLFFYFYPYRDYASAAARAGHVPLWNPFLFMGVPFLANSQAGFFYPPNLALAGLPVERSVNASIVLHAALAATGAYLWGRERLRLGRPGAWLTGLCYGLGGYFVAQVEHLNQVQVLAWLPWLLWLYPQRAPFHASGGVRWGSWAGRMGLALVIALQFLAGHIQSVFICLVGLIGYAVLPVLWDVLRVRARWRQLVGPLVVVAVAALGGGALAAVQLLPTLELARLSIRGGGLPYNEAVSFSLRPELVGRALLPSWGSPLFPEFVAYVGVGGLALAVVGLLAVRSAPVPRASYTQSETERLCAVRRIRRARCGAVALAALGLFLAWGGFNPVYFLLVKLVPGFGLFRAPARWLALYAAGAAGLVGLGLEGLMATTSAHNAQDMGRRPAQRWPALYAGWMIGGVSLAALVLLGQLLGGEPKPDLAPPLGLWSVMGWLAAALSFGVMLYLGFATHRSRRKRLWAASLMTLVAVELLGASLFLPINRATAPGALTSLRPAVTHLKADTNASWPSAPARVLSISDIFFDPGDKPEIELNLRRQLSADALYDYIIATKQKEVLIPNLPLYYRLHAVDGYDGGVLPLRRFVTLERLFMPEEQVAIDGRLRENLQAVPDGRWLSLFNARYVITDKVGDAWFDGVFYDLQMGATLGSGDEVAVGYVPTLVATAFGIVYQAEGAAEGTPLANAEVIFADGRRVSLPLLADDAGTGDRVARLSWGWTGTPSQVSLRGVWNEGAVVIRGLTLVDERTDVFLPLVLSDTGLYRLVHSGDVKIYENLEVLPRAFFVPEAIFVPDDESALAAMRDPDFDPGTTVVLTDGATPDREPTCDSGYCRWGNAALGSRVEDQSSTEIMIYEPERIVVSLDAPDDGWLLFSDAWYPGWQARLDGAPVPTLQADILFRAVAVPAGVHRIEWVFRPLSVRLGLVTSVGALVALLAGMVGLWLRRPT